MKKSLPGAIPRFFAAWITMLACTAVRYHKDILTVAQTEKIGTLTFLLLTALLFLALTLLSFYRDTDRAVKVLLMLSSTVYASVIAYTAKSVFTGTAAACVLAFLFYYCLARKGKKEWNLPSRFSVPASALAALLFALFVGTVTVLRYKSFAAPNYDFGIFSNMFYNMKERFVPLVSCERDGILSHFAVHISPVYYLILPFYCLFPSPITLQIAQAVILASGVIPLYLLAKKLGFSNKAAFLWCCVYSFYPALSGGCMFDLHENCFLVPFLLWMFLFFEKGKTVPMYIFAVLTLTVKEDAAVYLAFFALYLLFSRKKYRDGGILFALSVGCFLAESYLLSNFGEGVMNYRYSNYFSGDGSMVNVLLNVIKNPALVLNTVLNADRIEFLLTMLVPLAFLPFLTGKKLSRLILVCPLILVNLMPQYGYQYSIYFQYVFGSAAFLLYGALLTASETKIKPKRALPAICAAASLLLFLSTAASRGSILKTYSENAESYAKMEEAIETVPEDASVKASTFLIAHLASRDEIYELSSEHDAEYIVIDLRYPSMENNQSHDLALREDPAYECTVYLDKLIAIYRKK